MNPYQTIWLSPKQTFSSLATQEKQPLFFWPILVFGVSFGWDQAYATSALLDKGFTWWTMFATIPIGIGMSFLILSFIMPGLVTAIGRMWKGQTTMRKMVNVYSISTIPFAFLLIYQIVIFLFGGTPILGEVNQLLTAVLWLWSFALLIIGISKVQKFSYGMALLNIFLSYLPFLLLRLLTS